LRIKKGSLVNVINSELDPEVIAVVMKGPYEGHFQFFNYTEVSLVYDIYFDDKIIKKIPKLNLRLIETSN